MRRFWAIVLLCAAPAAAQVIPLGDINRAPGDSTPRSFTSNGGLTFFIADDARSGSQPWRTDGTAAGTVKLREAFAFGSGGPVSVNFGLATAGSTTFASVRFSGVGTELAVTDGTVAGTVLLKDLRPGPVSSIPGDFTPAGARLFFTAADAAGRELWVSDGTAAGTVRVADVRPGSGSPGIQSLTAVGPNVFFFADDGTNGRQLWFSDGTAGGTVRLTSGGNAFGELAALGTTLIFALDDGASGFEPWVSDGTPGGTVQVADLVAGASGSNPSGLLAFGGALYFQAGDGASDYELWKTNGTALGTSRVIDLEPGASASLALPLRASASTLYFTATVGGVPGLYQTDGTSSGTSLVRDFTDGGSFGTQSRVVGARLYFARTTAAEGTELWTSDGTTAGTQRIRDLFPGAGSGLADTGFGTLGARLLFAGSDGVNGVELWATDGTSAGTTQVAELFSGTQNGNPFLPVPAFSGVAFSAYEPSRGVELWRARADAGVEPISDIEPGPPDSEPTELVALGSEVYFAATTTAEGRELWVSDGTDAGTRLAADLEPGTGHSQPFFITAVNGTVLFFAETSSEGLELFRSNGTAGTTSLVRDLNPGPNHSNPQSVLVLGNTLLFSADDGTVGNELWKSDGTLAGTVLVRDIHPTGSSLPEFIAAVGNTAYFLADDGTNGRELWKTDGTTAGTELVRNIAPGAAGITTRRVWATLGSTLYFDLNDGQSGIELWKTDGTASGTVQVVDLNPGDAGSNLASLAVLGGALYFNAAEPDAGFELWRTDGTAAGTTLVRDLNPGPAGGVSLALVGYDTATGPRLAFAGNDGVSGTELWSTDGTAAGTHRLADLAPGAETSFPFGLVRSGNDLFFSAFTDTGAELWMYRPDFTPPAVTPTVTGTLGTNGWYTSNVTVSFSATDGESPADGCAPTLISADTASQQVSCTAASEGGSAAASITIKRDATAPVLSCPTALNIAATSLGGADVTYSATASDNLDPSPTLTASQDSGTLFPLGQTAVTVTAADEAGNLRTCNFTVLVSDRTPPALSCPSSGSFEATGPDGAVVNYLGASANDVIDSTPTVTYSQDGGTLFPLGLTVVNVNATDDSGNLSSCSFGVTVRDTLMPAVTCPPNVAVEATNQGTTLVNYPPATAADLVDGEVTLTYSQRTATGFPVGTTVVTVTGTDDAGNAGTCTFLVTVRDATPPLALCPSTVTLEATSLAGAAAIFPPAQAVDAVDPAPAITYSHASGSVFPLGRTQVTATARDDRGNERSCVFEVVVQDTTPPRVTCPPRVVATSADGKPVVVSYDAAAVEDAADPAPVLTYSIPSGAEFDVGQTLVSVTARDAAGRSETCFFQVAVRGPDTTGGGCGCGAAPASQLSLLGFLLLALRGARRRRG